MDFDYFKKFFQNLFTHRERQIHPESVEEVCVFPLPNMVLFPGVILPLHIFEDRYKMMMDHLLENKNTVLAMSLAKIDQRGQTTPTLICGAGSLNVLNQYPDGRRDIIVQGEKRLKIVKFLQTAPYIKALAEAIPDIPFQSSEEESRLHEHLKILAKRWIFLSPDLSDRLINYVNIFGQPHHLADCIAHYFLPSGEEKQSLLETLDRKARVDAMIEFVRRKVEEFEQKKEHAHLDKWNSENKVLH